MNKRKPYGEAEVQTTLALLGALLRTCQGRDIRIAQVIGNLGDCYYMEDPEYLTHLASTNAELQKILGSA